MQSILEREESNYDQYSNYNQDIKSTLSEPHALVLIKKYEFQVREEVYETTGKGGKQIKTRNKVAVLVISDIYRHVKNQSIDWLVLKEAQEIVVDVN